MTKMERLIELATGKCPTIEDMKYDITGKMQHLPPISALQQANAEKLEKAKERLGSNWILHKDSTFVKENTIKRKEGV